MHRQRVFFCCLPSEACRVSQKGTYDSLVLACVGRAHSFFVFFSNRVLYGEKIMIFAEPVLEILACLVPCSETEGSGLSLDCSTSWSCWLAEVDGVGSWGKTVGKSEGATVDWLEELASFNWKSLNCVGWVAICVLKYTVGCCELSAKSPTMGYPIVGTTEDLILGARHVGIQPQIVAMPHCKTAYMKYQVHLCTITNLGQCRSVRKKNLQNSEEQEIKSKFVTRQNVLR